MFGLEPRDAIDEPRTHLLVEDPIPLPRPSRQRLSQRGVQCREGIDVRRRTWLEGGVLSPVRDGLEYHDYHNETVM